MQITCRLCCLMTCHVVSGGEQRGEKEQIHQNTCQVLSRVKNKRSYIQIVNYIIFGFICLFIYFLTEAALC